MAYNVKARRGESRYTKDSSKYGTDVKETNSSKSTIGQTYTYKKYVGGRLMDVTRNVMTGRETIKPSSSSISNIEPFATRQQTSRLKPGQSTILRNAQGQRLRVQRTRAGELLFGRLDRRGEAFMREKAEALARKKKQGRPLLGKDIFQAAGYKKGQPLDVLRELGKLKAAIGKERQVILAQNFAKKYKTSVSKATIASIRKSGLTKSTINKLQKDAAAVQNFINYARNTLGVSYEREPAFLRMSKVAAYVKKQTGKQTPRATSYTIKRWRSRKLKDVLNDPSKLITSQIQISQLYLQERGKRIQSEVSGGKINRKRLFYDMVDKSNLPAWGKALLKKNVDVSNYIVVSFDEMARNTVEVLPIALYNAALKYVKVGELMLRSKDKRQFFRKLGLEHAKGEAAAKEAMKEAIKDPMTYAAALAMLPEIYAGISKSGAFTKTTFPSFAKVNASYPRLSLARLGSALRTVGKYAIPRGKLASFNVGVKTFQRQLKRPISKAAKRKGVTRAGQKQQLAKSQGGNQYQTQKFISITKEKISQTPKITDKLNKDQLKSLYSELFAKNAPNVKKGQLKGLINRKISGETTPTFGKGQIKRAQMLRLIRERVVNPDFQPFKKVEAKSVYEVKNKGFDYIDINRKGDVKLRRFPQRGKQPIPKDNAFISVSSVKYDSAGRAFLYLQKVSQKGGQFLTKKYLKSGRQVTVKAQKPILKELRSVEQIKKQGFMKQNNFAQELRPGMSEQQVTQATRVLSKREKRLRLKIQKLAKKQSEKISARRVFKSDVELGKFFKQFSQKANSKANFEIKAEIRSFMGELSKETIKISKPKSKKTSIKSSISKTKRTTKQKVKQKNKVYEVVIEKRNVKVEVKNTYKYAKGTLSKNIFSNLNRLGRASVVATSFATAQGRALAKTNAYKYAQKNTVLYEQKKEYIYEQVQVSLIKQTKLTQKTSPAKPVRKPGQRPTSTRTTKVISSPKPPKLPRGKRKTEYFTEKTPRLPLPKPPKLPKMPQGVKNPKGYDVYIKRGKAYKRLNPFSLTGPSAAKFGKWLTNNAVARSFVIVGTLRKGRAAPKYVAKTPSGLFRKPKKNSKLRTTSVVEKRKYAINTRGERKGLSAARVLSAAKRKVTKKRTKKKK